MTNAVFFFAIYRPAKIVRDAINECTGSGGLNVEDEKDYCMGWKQISVDKNDNCTRMEEYEYGRR